MPPLASAKRGISPPLLAPKFLPHTRHGGEKQRGERWLRLRGAIKRRSLSVSFCPLPCRARSPSLGMSRNRRMTKVVHDAGERKGGLHFHGRRLAPWQVYLFSTASSRVRDCDEQCRCVVAARMASSTLAAFFVEGRGGSFPNMRAARFT